MVAPKITAADLVALRDGSEAAIGVEITPRNNPVAQLALLEARLLALALSMPRDARFADDAELTGGFFDTETLSAYLRGELADEALSRFESDVRGNPSRFAELVAFKNAYFGRTRTS